MIQECSTGIYAAKKIDIEEILDLRIIQFMYLPPMPWYSCVVKEYINVIMYLGGDRFHFSLINDVAIEMLIIC